MKYQVIAMATMVAVATFAAPATTNEIVVSATRIETPIEQSGSSISVIDANDIQWQHATDAQASLKLVPGLQFTQSGGPGTASSVFIRGANANHTLVLVNGIRVNSNTTGSFNLSTIPTAAIERIEVLRGPQSALYGSDAIGGVINIVTRKGTSQPLGGSLLVETGTKGYFNTLAQLSGGNDVVDFTAAASLHGLQEFDIASAKGGMEDDPYEQGSLFTDMGLNFADDGRADLTLMYNRNETSLDGWQGFDTLDKTTETEFWSSALDISKPVADILEQSVKIGYNEEQNTDIQSGATLYYFETRNYDLNARSDFFVLENDTLSIGYDFRRSEAANDGQFSTINRDQNSLYLNNQWNLKERLYVTLGGRYDHYSDFDSKSTWQGNVSWFILDDSRLHGSIGTGYKVPTFNDMYWPYLIETNTFFGTDYISESQGNANLEAEESRSFDIGLEQSILNKSVVADITYFQNEVDNLINWADISTSTSTNPVFSFWTPSNVNNAKMHGVETSITITPCDTFSTRLGYTYTHAEDADTGKWLLRRARHTANLSATWDYSEKGLLVGDVAYVGKRYEDQSNSTELKAYALVHIGTRYHLSDTVNLVADINNLLDKYYETAKGYGSIGRVVSAGMEVIF